MLFFGQKILPIELPPNYICVYYILAADGCGSRLPRRELLVESCEKPKLLCTLVDLLLAFCYDHRTTLGEPTCESAWTVRSRQALVLIGIADDIACVCV